MSAPNICFSCGEKINRNESDGGISLFENSYGRSHEYMIFHTECFKTIAGKKYMPLQQISYEDKAKFNKFLINMNSIWKDLNRNSAGTTIDTIMAEQLQNQCPYPYKFNKFYTYFKIEKPELGGVFYYEVNNKVYEYHFK